MRGLGGIIYKESLQMLRDPAALFIALLVPIIQLTIFGYAIDTEVKDVETIILDLDKTSASRDFIDRFEATGLFEVQDYAASKEELYEGIVASRAKVGVIIPSGYGRELPAGKGTHIQVLIDGSNNTIAGQTLSTVQNLGLSISAEVANLASLRDEPPLEIRPRLLFNPSLRSAVFFVPGIIGILLFLVTMMLTSFSLVRERELGTLEQLMVTPVSKGALLAGKVLPNVGLGMLQMLVVLFFAQVIFKIEVVGSLWLLLVLALLFVVSSLSLGLIISTLARTQIQAMMGSFSLMLPSVLLSGFIFPRESMPLVIYWISCILPVTYFVEILRGVILKGAGFSALWDETLALAIIGVVLFTFAGLRFRKSLG